MRIRDQALRQHGGQVEQRRRGAGQTLRPTLLITASSSATWPTTRSRSCTVSLLQGQVTTSRSGPYRSANAARTAEAAPASGTTATGRPAPDPVAVRTGGSRVPAATRSRSTGDSRPGRSRGGGGGFRTKSMSRVSDVTSGPEGRSGIGDIGSSRVRSSRPSSIGSGSTERARRRRSSPGPDHPDAAAVQRGRRADVGAGVGAGVGVGQEHVHPWHDVRDLTVRGDHPGPVGHYEPALAGPQQRAVGGHLVPVPHDQIRPARTALAAHPGPLRLTATATVKPARSGSLAVAARATRLRRHRCRPPPSSPGVPAVR